ncbi:MAG TPA: discoidin domain-containing protein, partial [Panacibacter sp.]|nr:discoidin domain-containing protein [Panacibacter sp.]
MKSDHSLPAFLLIVLFLFDVSVYAQSSVLTQHNDLNRTGWYSEEKLLNTKNVKAGSFGKIFTRTVDDQIYAQPLVMLNVAMPAAGNKNVVFVATVNNTVYAFDADSANIANPYWQVNLSPAGTRAIKNTDMTGACGGGYRDFSGNMGIVGTPVIDAATNTLYVVARSVNTGNNLFQQYLHALDIKTGLEKANSPKLITAQVPGTGDGNIGGIVYFDAQKQNQRSGLLLLNGNIYIAYASHCDWGPYHGWILGYDKTSLQQTRVYNTTPNGYFGGIWMAGAAPAADELGNIYAAVGNGSVGTGGNPGNPINRSESALKLTPAGTGFTLNTFFSPVNIAELEAADLDFGVTQMLLIPGTNRAMTSCKDGHIYLMNRDNMGGYSATTNNVVQTIDLGVNAHLRSSLSYYKGTQKEFVYSWSENALLKAFPYNRITGQFDLGSTISSGVQGPVGNNGALLSVSSNAAVDSTAVLWASYAANGDANQSVRPGILRAFDANDITKELWNSSQYQADNPGNYAKFNCPTVVNGKVYLATFSNKLVVYGLTSGNAGDTCNTPNIALNKTGVASSLEGIEYQAGAAFDGNGSTRWSSQYSDPQSIYIDLGKRYDLCKVVLRWETALGKDFKIQLSDDAVNWATSITITGNTGLENYLPIRGSARYVRMYGTARGTEYGYSLWEFEVYGKESASGCADPSNLTVTNIYENAATLNWNGNGASS